MRRVLVVVLVLVGVALLGASLNALLGRPQVTQVYEDPDDTGGTIEVELVCDAVLGRDSVVAQDRVDLTGDGGEDGDAWTVDSGEVTDEIRCAGMQTRAVAVSGVAGALGLVDLCVVVPLVRRLSGVLRREDWRPPDPDAPFRA